MRLRITFIKNENMRYTGHLDVYHALERTFRRADLPVAYSQGFNQRPRLNLASALPLGLTSLGELAEVWLLEPRQLTEVQTAISDSAPPGLVFTAVEEVPDKSPKLPTLIQAAEYRVALETAPPDLEERIARLLAADSLPRTRRKKTYDLRPLVEEIIQQPVDEAGPVELLIRLVARPNATGRVDEVLKALGIAAVSAQIERTKLILEDEKPPDSFELLAGD
jgi:radical SAM-linked protein